MLSKTKKRNILLFMIAFLLLLAGVALYAAGHPADYRADKKRLQTESYDAVFLSMYPIDSYSQEEFAYYYGQKLLKTTYEIPDLRTLSSYLKTIGSSGQAITTIYLGILPEKTDADRLASLLQAYPDCSYVILPAYPALSYWSALSVAEQEQLLTQYSEFFTKALSYELPIYWFADQEWFISNPSNYITDQLISEDAAHTILVNLNDTYRLTSDNLESRLAGWQTLLAANHSNPAVYPDLSDWDIVFFGDSVIGNFTDSTSIPGVVAGLTGAHVYNLGMGGGSASKISADTLSFPDMVALFLNRDQASLADDTTFAIGLSQYLRERDENRQLLFVINYGLNDYFNHCPVNGTDPLDEASYTGALRTGISALQQAYPEAYIVIDTPNYTSYSAEDNASSKEGLPKLTDYVDAVLSLASELQCSLYDSYHELPIEQSNFSEYLNDACHPNYKGRFLIAKGILKEIEQLL